MSKTAEDVVDAVSQLFKCWSCFLHRYLRWWWFQYLTADALRQAVGQPDRFRQAVSGAVAAFQSAASGPDHAPDRDEQRLNSVSSAIHQPDNFAVVDQP